MEAVFLLAVLLPSSAIVIVIIFVSIRGISPFLNDYPYEQQDIVSFLTKMIWRKDQGVYGVGFIVINTLAPAPGILVISFLLPVLAALFIAKTVPKYVAGVITTIVELLANISSVVYDIFASGTITALANPLASSLDFVMAGGSLLLAVILLLTIMIFLTTTSLSITAICSVDREVEFGSLALGAAQTQTSFKVTLASVKSGIFAGVILGTGRAFGKATAIAMVMGNKMPGPTVDMFDTTRTLTATMLAGLKEVTELDYDMRFSAGLMLMAVILLSSLPLNLMKKKVGNMR